MIDYHIHTNFSDGKNTHVEYLKKSEQLGLKEIGFSDHLCLNYPNWAAKERDFKTISEAIVSLKNQNNSNSKIRFGFEVDYIEGKEDEISEILKRFELDYIIGSVHYIKEWNFDTNKKDFIESDIDKFYIDYFNLVQKAARSELFDIIGHIDLAKKFNYYPKFDLNEIYNKTAKVLKESDVTFELNTSGMDKPCKEFYPSDQFLKILFQYGVPVTLGSDSHQIDNLARYFDIAISKLKEVGYSSLAIFENRKRKFIAI